MAVRTHTVKAGDTLWAIAEKYLGSGAKYKQIATLNKISNPNRIAIGTVLKIDKDTSGSGSGSGSGSSSSSSSTKKTTSSNMANVTQFGLQSDSENLLFAVWTWSKSNVDNYSYQWEYDTGDGHWFIGNHSTTTDKESTYSIPSNAKKVRFRIKPVAKTHKVNKKDTPYWKADWSSWKTFNVADVPPEAPSAPNVDIEKNVLTTSLDIPNADTATHVQFEIVKDDVTKVKTSSDITFVTLHAEFQYNVDLGSEYKVRARLKNKHGLYSEWSEYSANKGTMPAAITSAPTVTVKTETSVFVKWPSVKTANSYRLQYTTEERYFDTSPDNVSEKTIDAEVTSSIELTGLESGHKYFFRVRAENSDGEGGWSKTASTILGTDPAAPTTWSSSTTVITGEELNLYWIHNSEDGSSQSKAILELIVNGVKKEYRIVGSGRFYINSSGYLSTLESYKDDLTTDADESVKTNSCKIDTSEYNEGVKIQWRVQTAGITGVYGEWSVQRTIDIYAKPSLEFRLTYANDNSIDVLESFPIKVYALPGPKTQAPIGYHLTVIANESYETVDEIGNVKMVNHGEVIYSNYFDIRMNLETELSAWDIDFENGISYTATCIVSMDSGLTAEDTQNFTVAWTDAIYQPNAEIVVDVDTVSANIRPYCEETVEYYYPVTYSNYEYVKGTEPLPSDIYGELVEGAITSTGEKVYSGMDEDGNELYFCIVPETITVEGVTLSVYRREFDGTFTEIATNIKNGSNTYVTDPHPSLDYARYRIVAMSESTGAVSYYDVPGVPVAETAIIIQWDEDWRSFDTNNEDELEQPPWTGSMLKLPYNVDVSDSNKNDVSLIEYIGRRHPVSYYGTQVGQAASWSTEVPITDKETLYQLRRLAIWMGDVYVREPSGSGYWANISVSFSQTHCEMTIPVSLDIVRVEGGI